MAAWEPRALQMPLRGACRPDQAGNQGSSAFPGSLGLGDPLCPQMGLPAPGLHQQQMELQTPKGYPCRERTLHTLSTLLGAITQVDLGQRPSLPPGV